MSIEHEFDADFLRWLAAQDPRFLDFMFRFYLEGLKLAEQGVAPTLPGPPTGKRVKVRFYKDRAEFDAAQRAFEREAGITPISDEEIEALWAALNNKNPYGPNEGA